MSTIKAGYRLTVTSWENDADNYRTISKDGYTKDQMAFLVEFVELFYSRNNYRGPKGFGNLHQPSDGEMTEIAEAFAKVVAKHSGAAILNELGYSVSEEELTITEEQREDLELNDALYDLVNELHGEFFGGGEFQIRVLDKFVVEQIPEDVKWKDVTSQFVKKK